MSAYAYEERSVEKEVAERYNLLVDGFRLAEKGAPSISILLSVEIKALEDFRDDCRRIPNLHRFWREGWFKAMYGVFKVTNAEHNFYLGPGILEGCEPEYQERFIEVSEAAIEACVDGMARFRYYVWLKERETTATNPILPTDGGEAIATATTTTTAILSTGLKEVELTALHNKLGAYLKLDLSSWLYWFNGVPTSKPKQMEWLKTRPELLYFIEKLCPDDFKPGSRKIKELNQIFKPRGNKKIGNNQSSTTDSTKRSAIIKLFK